MSRYKYPQPEVDKKYQDPKICNVGYVYYDDQEISSKKILFKKKKINCTVVHINRALGKITGESVFDRVRILSVLQRPCPLTLDILPFCCAFFRENRPVTHSTEKLLINLIFPLFALVLILTLSTVTVLTLFY